MNEGWCITGMIDDTFTSNQLRLNTVLMASDLHVQSRVK